MDVGNILIAVRTRNQRKFKKLNILNRSPQMVALDISSIKNALLLRWHIERGIEKEAEEISKNTISKNKQRFRSKNLNPLSKRMMRSFTSVRCINLEFDVSHFLTGTTRRNLHKNKLLLDPSESLDSSV